MRVLFWGTPDFAVPPLSALIGEGFEVVGVVTQPDRAVGRSRSTLEPPPVKTVALAEQIPVLQPERPRGDEFVSRVRELAPDISVVVAYGHILPQEVIDLPRLGTINIHASLLPKLRGAAPIQAAILQGLDETGITIMRMVKALDAGPSILQMRTPIPADETYGELQMRLAEMGALALVEALALFTVGAVAETAQDDSAATYAPKVDRMRTRIDWTKDAQSVARMIRAFDPKPGAYSTVKGADVKLFGGRTSERELTGTFAPGEVVAVDANGMTVACLGGAVEIGAVHPAGKRRVAPKEWASGRGISVGERLS
ncbi:MAG TPA: methionyl-tRNA formyltransferase [Gemmatimonadaceae bacterium]|nr:methionyl-tRNA formyltransferase [Gemmatimonadaceae bacterium]